MSAEFGQLVRAAMQDKHLSQGKTAALVGVYDNGRYLDATQMRLIMTGERKPTRALVQRLVEVLAPYLDAADAWAAAGILPPGVTADMLRRLDLAAVGARAKKLSRGTRRSPAQLAPVTTLPVDPDLGTWIEPLRPHDERRLADRRKHDRRGWRRVLEPAA